MIEKSDGGHIISAILSMRERRAAEQQSTAEAQRMLPLLRQRLDAFLKAHATGYSPTYDRTSYRAVAVGSLACEVTSSVQPIALSISWQYPSEEIPECYQQTFALEIDIDDYDRILHIARDGVTVRSKATRQRRDDHDEGHYPLSSVPVWERLATKRDLNSYMELLDHLRPAHRSASGLPS